LVSISEKRLVPQRKSGLLVPALCKVFSRSGVSQRGLNTWTLLIIPVSALWYWGYTLNGLDPTKYIVPRAIMYVVWPLTVVSLGFAFLMYKGVPEYYHQVRHLA